MGTFKSTNTDEFRAKVEAHILGAIYDYGLFGFRRGT